MQDVYWERVCVCVLVWEREWADEHDREIQMGLFSSSSDLSKHILFGCNMQLINSAW